MKNEKNVNFFILTRYKICSKTKLTQQIEYKINVNTKIGNKLSKFNMATSLE